MDSLRKDDDFRLYRMISLYTILLQALHTSRPWLSTGDIRRHLADVEPQFAVGDTTFYNRLASDIATLRHIGVPIARREDTFTNTVSYRLREDKFLPPVEFTAGEWEVLQIVSKLATGRTLGEPASLSVLKLAGFAAGHERTEQLEVRSFNEILGVDPTVIRQLTAAARYGVRATLAYRRDPTATVQQRNTEPWGVFAVGGRAYVIVYDLDRQDPRTFRLTRIEHVEVSRNRATAPRPKDIEAAMYERLRSDYDLVTARLTIAEGQALEVSRVAELVADGTYLLHNVPRHWVVEQALHYSDSVVVTEPADVRAEIMECLKRLEGSGQ